MVRPPRHSRLSARTLVLLVLVQALLHGGLGRLAAQRVAGDGLEELHAVQRQKGRGRGGRDRGYAGHVAQERDLAEVLPGPEPGQWPALLADLDLTRFHHVEPVARVALLDHHLSG